MMGTISPSNPSTLSRFFYFAFVLYLFFFFLAYLPRYHIREVKC